MSNAAIAPFVAPRGGLDADPAWWEEFPVSPAAPVAPPAQPEAIDTLLDRTVDLLIHGVETLRTRTDDDPSRAAADAARLTAAVAQLVRAHHLRAGPAAQEPSSAAALAAALADLDAELERDEGPRVED